MNKVSFRIKAKDLPSDQAARFEQPLDPDEQVEITIEEVPDHSKLDPDTLESQIAGIEKRLESTERADQTDVEAIFDKWTRDSS